MTTDTSDDTEPNDDVAGDTGPTDDDGQPQSALTRSLWRKVAIDPVEIALPAGVGLTLRAYRIEETEPEDAESEDDETDDVNSADEDSDADESDDAEDEDSSDKNVKDKDAKDEEPAEPEEVPVFLAHDGKLLLFRSPEGLVEFVRSDAPHDLTDLEEWSEVVDRIQTDDVAASDDDKYELDLVVANLRGGHDAWDPELLVPAGEIARDLGYALEQPAILSALSSGSPLDDLDEALRASESGALKGLFGRRRLRKIGAEQAALAWRSIIGKISTATDWRD